MSWNSAGNIRGPQGLKGDKGDPGDAADIASLIHAAASKTPVDADELPLLDSAGSWGLRKFTWSALKTVLQSVFFYRGNILGTVSQSGGVPTGAVMEVGTNANGSFYRFASGLQVTFNQLNVPAGSMAGGTTASLGSVAFPAAFASTPTFCFADWGGAFVESVYTVTSRSASTAAVYARNLSAATVNYPSGAPVYIISIGRWF